MTESNPDVTELKLIKEERSSTQRCLQICDQLSEHINQIQLNTKRDASSPGPNDPDAIPEMVTDQGLQECRNSLAHTVARLERHMKDVMNQLVAKSKTAMTSEDEIANLARLREEWETARQSVDICSRADSYLKENVSKIDNYATGDAVQFMVSTNGKVLHGKNRGLGWRSRQVGGYMSDTAVIHLSRDMNGITIQKVGNDGPSSQDKTPPVPDEIEETGQSSEFGQRYGRGMSLNPKTTSDANMPSRGSAESGQK